MSAKGCFLLFDNGLPKHRLNDMSSVLNLSFSAFPFVNDSFIRIENSDDHDR